MLTLDAFRTGVDSLFNNKIRRHVFLHSPLRGDVKIHRLQPPYSAACCSQHIKKMPYMAVECCSIWLQPGVMNFDVFPQLAIQKVIIGQEHNNH